MFKIGFFKPFTRLSQRQLKIQIARHRAVLPQAQTEHVYFHEFMADDMGTLERIYDRADLGMSDEARAAIDHYIETHPRGRHGKVVYDLEGDFGIEREAVYEVFANYMEAFPVQRETPNA